MFTQLRRINIAQEIQATSVEGVITRSVVT